jgi:hypothetical protein
VALDVDVRLPRSRLEEIEHFFEHFAERRRLKVQLFDAREAEEIIRYFNEALAFVLQSLGAFQRAAFALVLRVLEIFREKLQIESKRAEMVLDFVDEATGQLSQLGVLAAFVGHGLVSGEW